MSIFIKNPHLPESRSAAVIIGEDYYSKLQLSLEAKGVELIPMPKNISVSAAVSSHADLSIVHLGGKKLILAREFFEKRPEFVRKLTNRGFEIIEAKAHLSRAYPAEAGLNVCIIGNFIMYNSLCVDSAVIESLPSKIKPVLVNQGYTKCSVCVVDEKSIITSDENIHKVALRIGIESLLIPAGDISLPGYDTGFIGGCGFKLSRTELAFTGRINEEKKRKAIELFLYDRNIAPVYLTDDHIFDVGSFIPITER